MKKKPTKTEWVIVNAADTKEFWSNIYGWVSRDQATVFPDCSLRLPRTGAWKKVKPAPTAADISKSWTEVRQIEFHHRLTKAIEAHKLLEPPSPLEDALHVWRADRLTLTRMADSYEALLARLQKN